MGASIAVVSLIAVASADAAVEPVPEKIAYVVLDSSDHDIYLMNPDGSEQTPLFYFAHTPAWSPDGTEIAYSDTEGTEPLVVRSFVGGSSRTISATGYNPTWSPDGIKIAYERGGNVYVSNADGNGDPVQLTYHGASDPAWSPDGRVIAFTTDRDGNYEIYLINANGTAPQRLTVHYGQDVAPAWSPDGQRIAFSRNDRITIARSDGSGLADLFPGQWPAFSPDGSRLVYAAEEVDGHDEPRRQIFVADLTGWGRPQQLTAESWGATQPDWAGARPAPPTHPCQPAPRAGYRDRDAARSAHRSSIDCVTFLNIARGATDVQGRSMYDPLGEVTRAQLASFIANTLDRIDVDLLEPTADRFPDISTNAHRRNINRLAHAGIISGSSDGRFRPGAAVSRQQMATFTVRAASYATGHDLSSHGNWFADVRRSNAHFATINAGLEEMLFSGTRRPIDEARSGTFTPKGTIARDQMATFVTNLLEWLAHTPPAPTGRHSR